MKKVIISILLCMLLCSCGSKNSNVNVAEEIEQQTPTKTKFEQFEDGLEALGQEYTAVTMVAELLGAEQGIKYKFSDWNLELYRFDAESDAYIEASKNKAVHLEGFGSFPAMFNGEMALLKNDVPPEYKNEIEQLFMNLK